MAEHIIPGDSLARTRTVLTVVLTFTLGLAAVVYTQSYSDTMLELRATHPRLATAGLKQLYQVLAVCGALLGTGLAGVLGTFSLRVFRSGQAPPAGMRVAFSTKVRTGRSARSLATCSLVLAGGVFAGSLLLAYHLWTVGLEYELLYKGPFRSA